MPFEFNEECLSAFHMLKGALISAPIMEALDWQLPFEVMCDAINYAVEVVLVQRKDDKPYAIYYASQTLDDAQMNYATIDKEFLAVAFVLRKIPVAVDKF